MLEKLELGNFKAFGDFQTIDLKPLTLLFGTNSAGKSTILQSLIYLSEAFRKEKWDIYTTQQGGEYIDFGGLANIVHKKDLNNTIHFGFNITGFKIVSPVMSVDTEISDLKDISEKLRKTASVGNKGLNEISLQELGIPYYDCAFTVRIGISPKLRMPVYFSITEEIASLILSTDGETEKLPVEADGEILSIEKNENNNQYEVDQIKPFSRFFLKRILFSDLVKEGLIQDLCSNSLEKKISEKIKNSGIGYDEDQMIAFWLEDESLLYESELLNTISSELNDLNDFFGLDENIDNKVYPIKNETSVKNFMEDINYVGYFRPVPERLITFEEQSQHIETPNDIWQRLLQNEILRGEVNEYLSDPDKLDMGYELVVHDWVNRLESNQNDRIIKTLEIKDLNNDTIVNLRELGQGVIQVIPIIAALLDPEYKLVSIEQPELHLHPALQTRLGKIFADIAKERSIDDDLNIIDQRHLRQKRKQILIETHSEHIIKSIQLEIAKQDGLRPDDVSIQFVRRDKEVKQSVIKKMELDKLGSFIEPWPDDFFELSADLSMERLRQSFKSRN